MCRRLKIDPGLRHLRLNSAFRFDFLFKFEFAFRLFGLNEAKMAGVILGFAPLHPPFAQVLHRCMITCWGILYPTLYASYLACKTTRQFTLSGAYGRWHSRFNGKKRSKSGKNCRFGSQRSRKIFFRVKKVLAGDFGSVRTVRSFQILLTVTFHYSCWCTFACTPKTPFLPFHTPQ